MFAVVWLWYWGQLSPLYYGGFMAQITQQGIDIMFLAFSRLDKNKEYSPQELYINFCKAHDLNGWFMKSDIHKITIKQLQYCLLKINKYFPEKLHRRQIRNKIYYTKLY